MRRLLIKPWRLSAIRQRLVESRDDQQGTAIFIPANAPAASGDIILRWNVDGRSANRQQAPVSDVVYTSRGTQDCR